MPLFNFTRKMRCNQRDSASQPGFLVIELLQGVLILGVLLLMVTAFHVLSVHWQHQAVARFEALDALSSQLSGGVISNDINRIQALQIEFSQHERIIPEFTALIGKPLKVEQKVAVALWQDERGNKHSVKVSS